MRMMKYALAALLATTALACAQGVPAGGGYISASKNKDFAVAPASCPNAGCVTASAYTANFVIGGLQTVPIFRTVAQPSALLNYVGISSKGGVTAAEVVYAFTALPASTCTDHAAFALNSADLQFLVPGFPIALTPAATAGTTQTSASYNPNVATSNADLTATTLATQNLYFCWVTTGTPTPASTTDLIFTYSALQD